MHVTSVLPMMIEVQLERVEQETERVVEGKESEEVGREIVE